MWGSLDCQSQPIHCVLEQPTPGCCQDQLPPTCCLTQRSESRAPELGPGKEKRAREGLAKLLGFAISTDCFKRSLYLVNGRGRLGGRKIRICNEL